MGNEANGSVTGVAVGASANGSTAGAAVGFAANGSDYGAAVGRDANGSTEGAAVGHWAYGDNYGTAMGYASDGYFSGVAVGRQANGMNTNVAIGAYATAGGGTERIAIGLNVANDMDYTARIRGTLCLDGAASETIYWRSTFGYGDWNAKAFTIDHPLDPANKVLRHFCLEGPQVWNVYAGNAQLVNGQAVVELPEYYSALNLVG
ncbi:MAG: hypothetical protein KKC23_09620, partial [Proteobacteria bacterium]|nr:hypothetical protein [Pseudomonadota bacterium]